MWDTVFVFEDQTELKWKPLPSIPPGGELMLMATDKFDDSKVPKFYTARRVILDVYGAKQYIHLKENDG